MRRAALAVLGATVLALVGSAVAAAPAGATGGRQLFPKVIALPDGFRPEGIATGRGTAFYVGSLRDGSVYRGDLVTGRGSILVPGQEGNALTGLEVAGRRLFAAGGGTGTAKVYDAGSGRLLAAYQLSAPGASFVNDVVVTRRAAYFTDSTNPVLYVLPLGRGGGLPAAGGVRTLPLTGITYADGINANGIEATPDGRRLFVVQSNTGLLFSVSPRTGAATPVDLGGASLTNGDGLLRRGRTLYAVRNQLNQIAVLRFDRAFRSARLVDTITDQAFDVPTTVAPFGPFLYAVNARFGTPPTPDTDYTVVRVRAR
ncbi:MAG TPA: superoxide dismutase [Mycobacteriales bacterium]|nr:superoxide dismutase [Mycobacteriales bacterium]